MKSQRRGKNISATEVVHISPFGVWLDVQGKEYFLSYSQYPWFRNATVKQIHRVELNHGHHLYWPDLDVDLELDALVHPQMYPLVSTVDARQTKKSASKIPDPNKMKRIAGPVIMGKAVFKAKAA